MKKLCFILAVGMMLSVTTTASAQFMGSPSRSRNYVSADAFIQAIKENQPDILCMSALLTTTMGYMKEVIDALEQAGIRDQVKVMVGGAPVTQGFADEIGADGYSDNANSAVAVAKQLLKVKK